MSDQTVSPPIIALFPVTYSTLSTSALLTDVLARYDIGDPAECRFFSRGVNDTYEVRTAGGAGFFLRVYRAGYRSFDEVGYEVDALNHLHRNGAAVARPVACRDDRFIQILSAPEGARYAVLFTLAPGWKPSYDKDPESKAFSYGRAVARLHLAARDFAGRHVRFRIDLDHLLGTPLQTIEPFLAHRGEDWAYVLRFAGELRSRIEALPASELEQGLCHGDLQGYHHHIAADGTATFFDFDFCGFGYRAYDLAVFRWCARLSNKENVWWEPYLRGYQEERRLNDIDVRAIPLFVGARYIWHMGLHTANHRDWGCGWLDDDYFDKAIQNLRAVASDYMQGFEQK